MFLSPAKVLIILVVALAVLGPESLPRLAKQIGGFWGQFKSFRQSLETQVRGSFPDLPSTETITQAVRSPLSFLDSLADHPEDTEPPPAVTDRSGPIVGGGLTTAPGPAVAGPSDPFERLAEELAPVGARGSQPVSTVHEVRSPLEGGPDGPGLN